MRYQPLSTSEHSLGPSVVSVHYSMRVSGAAGADQRQGWMSKICNGLVTSLIFLMILITFPVSLWFAIKTVPSYNRLVLFRLGRIKGSKGPGMVFVLPCIDQFQQVDIRTRALSVPPCKITSKDEALISVGAEIQFRIWNPVLSVIAVQDLNSSSQLTAQNIMTHILLKKSLKEIQMEKMKIGEELTLEINERTKPWGLEVDRVELILDAVLKPARERVSSASVFKPPALGLEGQPGPVQHLTMHFIGSNPIAPSPIKEISQVVCDNPVDEPMLPKESPKLSIGDEILVKVNQAISEGLVKQIGACFLFSITLKDGSGTSYFLDLTRSCGKAGHGKPERSPDVILEMSECDMKAMFKGNLKPLGAYMSGRLRVHGDLKTAMKLEELIKVLKQNTQV
ncbi:stomatin-like protein 1 isoform X1 [Callorhinchus milii]|uniref:stomatin-like protein 1 isoform X1 n=1 Tax=Callorhinchus milii TaxID=7868 RepID=UPI0004571BB2|nr:stomatin-like protein 1 isoform X1 [Callorhinchus milii]|eukprot:gi/632938768/ref/XP_007906297.1/ PREDICTED: stomatin-like protein 1 isoform X1 [Callorhinchus milii]